MKKILLLVLIMASVMVAHSQNWYDGIPNGYITTPLKFFPDSSGTISYDNGYTWHSFASGDTVTIGDNRKNDTLVYAKISTTNPEHLLPDWADPAQYVDSILPAFVDSAVEKVIALKIRNANDSLVCIRNIHYSPSAAGINRGLPAIYIQEVDSGAFYGYQNGILVAGSASVGDSVFPREYYYPDELMFNLTQGTITPLWGGFNPFGFSPPYDFISVDSVTTTVTGEFALGKFSALTSTAYVDSVTGDSMILGANATVVIIPDAPVIANNLATPSLNQYMDDPVNGAKPFYQRMALVTIVFPDNRQCGGLIKVRHSGQGSRLAWQVSMALLDDIECDCFTKGVMQKFNSMILRSFGSDQKQMVLTDLIADYVIKEEPMVSNGILIPAYINGEFIGISTLREDYDERDMRKELGLPKGDMHVYSFIDDSTRLLDGHELPQGSTALTDTAAGEIQDTVLNTSDYAVFASKLDQGSACLAVQGAIFWDIEDLAGSKNLAVYSSASKRRLFLHLEDSDQSSWDPAGDGMQDLLTTGKGIWQLQVITNKLLSFEESRHYFANSFADRLSTVWSPERLTVVKDSLVGVLAPSLPDHYNRWGNGPSTKTIPWDFMTNKVPQMDLFVSGRTAHVYVDVVTALSNADTASVTLEVVGGGSESYVEMSTLTVGGLNGLMPPFTSKRFVSTTDSIPLPLTAVPQYDDVFAYWLINGDTVTANPYTHVPGVNAENIIAVFAKDTNYVYSQKLWWTEASAVDDSLRKNWAGPGPVPAEHLDRIELHHPGGVGGINQDTVYLDGFKIVLGNDTMRLRDPMDSLKLVPGETLVFYADGCDECGVFHLDKKLSQKRGEYLALLNPSDSLLASVYVPKGIPFGKSYARCTGNWIFADTITMGEYPNWCNSFKPNNDTTSVAITEIEDESFRIYPVPAQDYIWIELSSSYNGERLFVYDMAGRQVREFDGMKFDKTDRQIQLAVDFLKDGVYVIKSENGDTQRFVIVGRR